MVVKELVDDVHEKLTSLLEKARTERENPYIVAILEQFVRLTNTKEPQTISTEEQRAEETAAAPTVEEPAPVPSALNFSQQMELQNARAKEWDETHPKL